jgi:hypothetical protein
MKTMAPSSSNFDVAKFVVSDAGTDWLNQSAEFGALVEDFCLAEATQNERPPEEVFRGFRSVGMGGKSQVFEVDGVAVKVCTPTTGKYYWRYGVTTVENLIGQYSFLSTLGQYLEHDNSQNIAVPQQLLAVRTHRGNYIRAEQLMSGWSSLMSQAKDRRLSDDRQRAINERVKTRIIEGVGGFSLKFGLMDLGLGRKELLHSANVLVPEEADELDEDRLCIIDQPSNGLRGKVASALAGRHLLN